MKTLKRFGVLSAIALAASVAVASDALAAQRAPAPVPVAAAQGPAVAADYVWQGHHYVYLWHGKYFNHRRWHNNVWVYY